MSWTRLALLLVAATVASLAAGFAGERHDCFEWRTRYQAVVDGDMMINGYPIAFTHEAALEEAGPLPPGCDPSSVWILGGP